jgi:hypothetical protein
MVIAAFARAKLLGIRLLTLDIRVVIVPGDARSDVASVAAKAMTVTPKAYPPAHRIGNGESLAHAVRLLEEGTKSLKEVRSIGDSHS